MPLPQPPGDKGSALPPAFPPLTPVLPSAASDRPRPSTIASPTNYSHPAPPFGRLLDPAPSELAPPPASPHSAPASRRPRLGPVTSFSRFSSHPSLPRGLGSDSAPAAQGPAPAQDHPSPAAPPPNPRPLDPARVGRPPLQLAPRSWSPAPRPRPRGPAPVRGPPSARGGGGQALGALSAVPALRRHRRRAVVPADPRAPPAGRALRPRGEPQEPVGRNASQVGRLHPGLSPAGRSSPAPSLSPAAPAGARRVCTPRGRCSFPCRLSSGLRRARARLAPDGFGKPLAPLVLLGDPVTPAQAGEPGFRARSGTHGPRVRPGDPSPPALAVPEAGPEGWPASATGRVLGALGSGGLGALRAGGAGASSGAALGRREGRAVPG